MSVSIVGSSGNAKVPDNAEAAMKPSTMAGHFKMVAKPLGAATTTTGKNGASNSNANKAAAAAAAANMAATAQKANKSAIRFRFNQGFSNAVRRPVNITDFL